MEIKPSHVKNARRVYYSEVTLAGVLATISVSGGRWYAAGGVGQVCCGKKEGFRGALSRAYGCGEDAGGSLQVGHPIGWVRGPCLALWLVLNRKLVKT